MWMSILARNTILPTRDDKSLNQFAYYSKVRIDFTCLNTVLTVYEYMSFAKSWQEKGWSSQAETWQVKNTLMKNFD